MSDACPVIVASGRTAVGTAFKGTLVDTSAFELARAIIPAVLERGRVDPQVVDDIVLAESLYGGGCIARHAAVSVGLGHVPGVALNRHCASGLSAIAFASGSVIAGMDDVVLAGGVQSDSTSPTSSWTDPAGQKHDQWWSPTHPDTPTAPNFDMSISVGWNTAKAAGLSRHEMDEWALRSHKRAIDAIDAGLFADEIVPLLVRRQDDTVEFAVDEHPRRGLTMERLAALDVLHPEIADFSITAGNASGMNDGAAAVVVTSATKAEEQGWSQLARIRSWATVADEPARMGLTPTKAIPKALKRAGLELSDIHLFEINEAFASVPLAACRILEIDDSIVNVNGSGCSIGHPVAASGTRMVVSLIAELERRGGGLGIASMCAGGGMGAALVIEVPANR